MEVCLGLNYLFLRKAFFNTSFIICILFKYNRYTNNTGFLHVGFVEIEVDVPKEVQVESEQGFVITLMLDHYIQNSDVGEKSNERDDFQHGELLHGEDAIIRGWKLMNNAIKVSNGVSTNDSDQSVDQKKTNKPKKKKKRKKKERNVKDIVQCSGLEKYVDELVNSTSPDEGSIKTPSKSMNSNTPSTSPNTQATSILKTLNDLTSIFSISEEITHEALTDVAVDDVLISVPPCNQIYQPQEGDIIRCTLPPTFVDKLLVRMMTYVFLLKDYVLIFFVSG